MTTKTYKLVSLLSSEESLVLDMLNSDGEPCKTQLTRHNVSAAHSNGTTLHVQSGDHFMDISMKSVTEAINCARWLNGEEIPEPVDHLQTMRNNNLEQRIEKLARDLLLQGKDPEVAWRTARKFYNLKDTP